MKIHNYVSRILFVAVYISTADTKRNFLPFALLQAPPGAQPVAHSAVV